MSFVRFSDDSDVYSYEDVGGGFRTWHNGEVIIDATLSGMRRTLQTIKGNGYKVPDWVFLEIDDELAGRHRGGFTHEDMSLLREVANRA